LNRMVTGCRMSQRPTEAWRGLKPSKRAIFWPQGG